MSTDKIKITKQELEDIYEVEEQLTQPKIEDNIDKPEKEKEPEFLTEEEQEFDDKLKADLNWDEEKE